MRICRPLLVAVVLSTALSGCSRDERPASRAAVAASPSPSPSPSASPSPSPSPSPSASRSPSAAPATAAGATREPATAPAVALTGDGIDLGARLLEFGTPFAEAEPALRAALGRPTRDSGETSSFSAYGTCPGSRLRALEYGGGALYVLFGDVPSAGLRMYQWSLTDRGTPSAVPQARALVGDAATFAFGVGDTLAEVRSGAQGAQLEVRPGDEMFPASFSLRDQSAGFLGFLTGTAATDRVTGVLGGQPCGE